MADSVVTQSNRLIEASYMLTLNEKRLMLMAISKLDGRKPMPNGVFRFSAYEFAETFHLDPTDAYAELKAASKFLFNRTIRFFGKGGKVVKEMRWVHTIEYLEGEGCIELSFTPAVAPELTKMHGKFTTYRLRHVSQLSSPYAIRLYELAAQYLKIGSRQITIDDLRVALELTELYPQFKELRRRVLDPAIASINTRTDLDVVLEPVLKGRKMVALKLFVKRKDTQLNLLPNDDTAA